MNDELKALREVARAARAASKKFMDAITSGTEAEHRMAMDTLLNFLRTKIREGLPVLSNNDRILSDANDIGLPIYESDRAAVEQGMDVRDIAWRRLRDAVNRYSLPTDQAHEPVKSADLRRAEFDKLSELEKLKRRVTRLDGTLRNVSGMSSNVNVPPRDETADFPKGWEEMIKKQFHTVPGLSAFMGTPKSEESALEKQFKAAAGQPVEAGLPPWRAVDVTPALDAVLLRGWPSIHKLLQERHVKNVFVRQGPARAVIAFPRTHYTEGEFDLLMIGEDRGVILVDGDFDAWLQLATAYEERVAKTVPTDNKIEFYAYESTHTVEGQKMVEDSLEAVIAVLQADDDARALEGHNGKPLPDKPSGYTSIDVLQELWGMPWNNLIVAYLYALEPTSVRVSTGAVCADGYSGRVTVTLNDDRTVQSISQEVRVGYGTGAEVDAVLRWAKGGYNPAQRPRASVGAIGHTSGLARVDFK